MSESWLVSRRQPRDSLATKIIFFVFLSTLVTALGVSWIAVHSTYAFLRAQLEQRYPQVLERSATLVADWLDDGSLRVREVAERVDHLLAPESGAEAGPRADAVAALLDAAVRHSRQLDSLVWLGRDGTPLARGGGAAALDAARAAQLDIGLSMVGDRLAAREPVGAHGSLVGVFATSGIAARIGPDALSDGIHLIDRDGRVVVGPAGDSRRRFERFPGRLRSPDNEGTAIEFAASDGRSAIGAARPLGALGWTLVVAQPFDVAFGPVFSVVSRVFVVDLAIVLLFSFLAYKITTAIVRPIEALSDGARRVSQGDLEVVVAETGSHDELGLLTRTFNDMTRRLRKNRGEIDDQTRRLRNQNQELQRANEVLEQLSITDGLTKLHNHRYFQETLTREIKRAGRTGDPLSMLLIDIDDFKRFNDTNGHAAGDALLVRIARILNESVRESDVLARYGGEEFVVLATGTDLDGALFLAEKIRTAVAETVYPLQDSDRTVRLTISIGVAEFAGDRRHFFHEADRALYRAKADGKNCVVAASSSSC
ncbi:MAG: diguanylate cyclase [Myxococcota bacterium]|nr:diguanylate cyclase [Myxococcota bacterium]